VIVLSDAQSWKQTWQSRFTDEGMQIDESDEQWEKAPSPIDDSRQPDSKVTFERDLQ
jgi:hypothetical protein